MQIEESNLSSARQCTTPLRTSSSTPNITEKTEHLVQQGSVQSGRPSQHITDQIMCLLNTASKQRPSSRPGLARSNSNPEMLSTNGIPPPAKYIRKKQPHDLHQQSSIKHDQPEKSLNSPAQSLL